MDPGEPSEPSEPSDPWAWDSDRLVSELCLNPTRWTKFESRKVPNLENIASALQELEYDGESLLKYDHEIGSRNELAKELSITKAPHRLAFLHVLGSLKLQSARYQAWINPDNSSTPVPAPQQTERDSTDRLSGPFNVVQEPSPERTSTTVDEIEQVPVASTEDQSPLPAEPSQGIKRSVDDTETFKTDVPKKKRRVAPILISTETQGASAAFLPSFADGVITPSTSPHGSPTQASSHDSYLGNFPWNIGGKGLAVQANLKAYAVQTDPNAPDSEFQWLNIKHVPPGRRLQAHRAMIDFLRTSSIKRIGNGDESVQFVDRLSPEDDPILPVFGDSDEESGSCSDEDSVLEIVELQGPQPLLDKEVEAIIDKAIREWEEALRESEEDWAKWKRWKVVQRANKLWHDRDRVGKRNHAAQRIRQQITTIRQTHRGAEKPDTVFNLDVGRGAAQES